MYERNEINCHHNGIFNFCVMSSLSFVNRLIYSYCINCRTNYKESSIIDIKSWNHLCYLKKYNFVDC